MCRGKLRVLNLRGGIKDIGVAVSSQECEPSQDNNCANVSQVVLPSQARNEAALSSGRAYVDNIS